MSNRTAKLVAAIFACMSAGASYAAVAETTTKTADTCLSRPKGAPPAGGHWYYHFDRATKRNCWYVGDAGGKTRAVAPQARPALAAVPATDPVPLQANPGVPRSVADAHAELPSPQTRVEPDAGVNAQPPTGGAASASAIEGSQRAIVPDAATPSSPVASRWPESSGVGSSDNQRMAAAEPPAAPQAYPRPAPQPAASPVALAAADSSWEKQSASTQILLLVMASALALAGITASLVFRFGRAHAARPPIQSERRAIWDSIDPIRSSPPLFPRDDHPAWRDDPIARDPRAPDDPERRVQEMLARLAKSART